VIADNATLYHFDLFSKSGKRKIRPIMKEIKQATQHSI
jgi:hypothetical protein